MQTTITILKDDLRRAFIYGLFAAVMTIALAFGVAAVIGDRLEEETSRQVTVVLQESQATRDLLCDVLAGADDKQIIAAIERNC